MISLRIALAIAVSLLVTACLPVTSTSPVGSTVGFAPDPALAGMWRGQPQKPDGPVYMTFLPQDDNTITAVWMTPPIKAHAGDWGVYSLQTTALGQYHYMNAKEVSSNGKPPDEAEAGKNFPLLYRVNGDGSLVVYLLDEKAAAAAIQSGKIAGTVDKGQFGDVTITAASSDLDAFMQTPAARALFIKPLLILKKVK